MKKRKIIFASFACLFLVVSLTACMSAGTRLLPQPADRSEVRGTYTLMLYGCRYAGDVENMAILVNEAGPLPVEIFAPNFMYTVKKGLLSPQALDEAETFVKCSFHSLWYSTLRKVLDTTGNAVAYEVKPLYLPWEFGVPEVLQSSYFLKGGKVVLYIRLDPFVENRIEHDGRGRDGSSLTE